MAVGTLAPVSVDASVKREAWEPVAKVSSGVSEACSGHRYSLSIGRCALWRLDSRHFEGFPRTIR